MRPLWRPKDKKIAILDQKNLKGFTAVKFFPIFGHQTLDSELDPDPYPQLEKMLDTDPHWGIKSMLIHKPEHSHPNIPPLPSAAKYRVHRVR